MDGHAQKSKIIRPFCYLWWTSWGELSHDDDDYHHVNCDPKAESGKFQFPGMAYILVCRLFIDNTLAIESLLIVALAATAVVWCLKRSPNQFVAARSLFCCLAIG